MKVRTPQDCAIFHTNATVDLIAIPFDKIERTKKDRTIFIRSIRANFVAGRKVLAAVCSPAEEVRHFHNRSLKLISLGIHVGLSKRFMG